MRTICLWLCVCTAMAILLGPPVAPAALAQPVVQGKLPVAILDFEPLGASKLEAAAASDRLRELALGTGQVVLVDRTQLDAVLNEQMLQQTGCTSQECAIKVGRVLGVRQLISGRIIKLGEGVWQVSALLVDAESSETLRVASITQEGSVVAVLEAGMPRVAKIIFPGQNSVPAPVASAKSPAQPPAAADAPLARSAEPRAPAPKPEAAPAADAIRRREISIAVFPWKRWGGSAYGPSNVLMPALTHAVQNVPGVRVKYTWYPEDTPGKAISADPEVIEKSRSEGFFIKGPNISYLRQRGKDLNVDGVLVLDQFGNTYKGTVVDVSSDKIYQGVASLMSNDRSKDAIDSIESMIQKILANHRDGA